MFRRIICDADRQHLHDDLLIEWSEKWQMLFSFEKCKCLQTGYGNEDVQYKMGGKVDLLSTAVKVKDLGLTTSADMNVSGSAKLQQRKETKLLD